MKNLIIPAGQGFEDSKCCILIYGAAGVGKTTLAASIGKRPLMLEFDNKASVRSHDKAAVDRVDGTDYANVLEVLGDPSTIKNYDSVIVDTMGECVRSMDAYLIKTSSMPKITQKDGKTLTQAGYGVRNVMYADFVYLLTQTLRKNVVFIGHEKVKNQEEGRITVNAGSDNNVDSLLKPLDAIGYMQISGRNRVISFAPSDRYLSKNSLELQEDLIIPDLNKGGIENDFLFATIIERHQNRLQQKMALNSSKTEILNEWLPKIDKVVNDIGINEFVQLFTSKDFPAVYDSTEILKKNLHKKAESLGLVFLKENKEYVRS